MTTDDNFLSRWSRLKRVPGAASANEEVADRTAVETAGPAADAPSPGDAPAAETTRAREPRTEPVADAAEAPHPAELIDIDKLTKHSDFSAFVMKGVPAALQRRALRKLWTLDPVLANLDGLNDYENIIEDFGISDLAPGSTGWNLGRGFMTDEDIAEVNRRGGYRPPEEREEDGGDTPDEIASCDAGLQESDCANASTDAKTVSTDGDPARAAAHGANASRQGGDIGHEDDEFEVGGGDDAA